MSLTNLNGLRIFKTVYDTRSMTEAAKLLHLTQSGVSQHVKALEGELGFPLFERVKKRLFPTVKGESLYLQTHRLMTEVETSIQRLQAHQEAPEGVVRVGLPIEFGNNIVLPRLAELGREYPNLNFSITLDFATVLSEMVLQGELDFALIDRFKVDRRLRLEPVASEVLLLCGQRKYVKQFGVAKFNAQFFSRLDYVDYKEGEPLVRSWFKHHLGRPNLPIRVRGHIFDVQGIAKFVTSGLGVGVLPNHLAEKLIKAGEDLYIFEGRKLPLKNEMCMTYLPLRERPLAQTIVMDSLRNLSKSHP